MLRYRASPIRPGLTKNRDRPTDVALETRGSLRRDFALAQSGQSESILRGLAPDEMIRQIVRAGREFSGAVDFDDDVTLVVVKRDGGDA